MNSLTFSVVIPTYNRGSVILETIESILAQTRQVEEIIVVDDGSTDDTGARLAPVMDRIVYIRQENAGVSAARNTGIRAASSEWICFLDSDDIWLAERMAILERDLRTASSDVNVHMANTRYDRGGAPAHTVFENKRIQAPEGRAMKLDDPLPMVVNGAGLHSLAFRADLFQRTGPFIDELRRAGDTWFLVRLAIEGSWIVTGDIGAVVRRLDKGEQGITEEKPKADSYRAQILATEYMLPGALHRSHRRTITRRLSSLHFYLAKTLNDPSNSTEFRQALWQSIAVAPLWPRAWARAIWLTLIGQRGLREP